MVISKAIVAEMRACFMGRSTECGGLLGERDGAICRFVFDEGRSSIGEYVPDTDRLNRILSEWRSEGIGFAGIAHTHLGGCRSLSLADEKSIREIYCAVGLGILYFPIVTFDEGEMILTVYKADEFGIRKVSEMYLSEEL